MHRDFRLPQLVGARAAVDVRAELLVGSWWRRCSTGAWRVTENSWNLLMAEDAPPEKLVHYFSIAHVAGLIAGFVAPIPYLFVQQYTVVPTIGCSMHHLCDVTRKFLILFFTAGGNRRG